jgi:hypothetical protein
MQHAAKGRKCLNYSLHVVASDIHQFMEDGFPCSNNSFEAP